MRCPECLDQLKQQGPLRHCECRIVITVGTALSHCRVLRCVAEEKTVEDLGILPIHIM